jgi:hypothetical protein
MTRKIYKSAMGKSVDLGALLLQNEQVRAVGNMGVNAAGDLVDGANNIIEQRHRKVQRQYRRQTNVSDTPAASSNLSARKAYQNQQQSIKNVDLDLLEPTQVSQQTQQPIEQPIEQPKPVTEPVAGGLAAAIARSREVKQELEKTMRQRAREQGIKKI